MTTVGNGAARAYKAGMDRQPSEHPDPRIDALLRERRPAPRLGWTEATEERLFAPRRRRFPVLAGPLRLGGTVAAGLATVLLALVLAGGAPFGSGAGEATAEPDCREVALTRMERVPSVVRGSDGVTRIVYKRKPVRRFVTRCE